MENWNIWSWEAKAKQITEQSKVGDRVHVGYLSDNDPYNYQEATISYINPYWYYPDGVFDGRRERCYQIYVRFDDGHEINWSYNPAVGRE